MDCIADTDPQLGYSSIFGLFLIPIGGAGLSVALVLLEAVSGAVGQKRSREGLPGKNAVPILVRMSEREKLLGELDRLRMRLQEKEELIKELTRDKHKSTMY